MGHANVSICHSSSEACRLLTRCPQDPEAHLIVYKCEIIQQSSRFLVTVF